MLKLMRDSFSHLKWILVAIVAVFILFIFVDWGAGGPGGQKTNGGYAARVNGDTISVLEYGRAVRFAEDNYRRMYGDQFTPQMEQQMGLSRQVLNSMIDQRLLLQEAARLHLTATPEEIQQKILQNPVLTPNGKFVGPELYEQYVRQLGFQNASEFEDEMGRAITAEKMESALTSAVVVSPKAAEDAYRRNNESAKIHYVVYSSGRELPNVNVTPAEVDAYYKAHEASYSHPEQRNLKYLVADVTRIRAQVAPSEQQLRERYEASKNTDFKRPEQAHVLHILIKVDTGAPPAIDAAAKAKADSLVKQLRAGGDFAALAKANSQDPSSANNGGDMGWVDKGSTVDPFDQAAFSVPLNTISDPIRSQEYGYHIIKVLERRAAGSRSFEEVRDALSNQMATQMAQDQAREEITRLAARMKEKKPGSPAEFSAFANDRVSSNDTQWFAAGEAVPGLGYNQPLADWAFSAKPGAVSDIIGTRRGPVVAYVAGIRPAGISPLDEIRARVEADAKIEKAKEVASQKLAAAMSGATSVDQVASKLGVTAQDAPVSRQGSIPGITGNASALIDAVMNAQVGQLKGPVAAGDGVVAFTVTDQKKVTPDELAKNAPTMIDTIRQNESRTLRQSLLDRLRKQSKVDVNDQALGQQNPNGSSPDEG